MLMTLSLQGFLRFVSTLPAAERNSETAEPHRRIRIRITRRELARSGMR